jgi:hypothetical protein
LHFYPLSYWLAGLRCGLEFDLARSANGVLREAVRKSPHNSHAVELSVRKKQNLESDQALNANTSSFACVSSVRPRGDFRFDVDFLCCESRDGGRIEEMCECAIVSAAIVLIFFGCYQ